MLPASLPAQAPNEALELARELELATHPEWLALLHYENRRGNSRYRSYVDDDDFFLAADGDSSPSAELAATLKAFFEQPDVQCRFVARRQWLENRFARSDIWPVRAACEEYAEWRRMLGTRQVVLVFASSYLNSPSSMYGHTFLRFDSANVGMDSPLLSFALNFGASVPQNEIGLVYAYRGLAGGYPGEFSGAPYYNKIKTYSRIEHRDLWEYRLNLTDEEIDRLLAHVWELREINFDYYFFDENCSLRLLELLDVARPGLSLAEPYKYYAIPIDTVRSVIDAGMIDDAVYRPANLTRLEHQLAQLPAEQRRFVKPLAADIGVLNDADFTALDPEARVRIAQTAYDYLRYTVERETRDPATARRSLDLLDFINRTTDTPVTEDAPPRPIRPEQGHETMLAALSGGVEDDLAFADFEWRLSYHDLLDASPGYPDGASLNMGRIVVRARESDGPRLQRLDVIEITSLSPRSAFFKPISWRVDFGLERQWTKNDDPLVAQVNGGAGLTWSPLSPIKLFSLVTGRLEYNPDLDRELDVAAGLQAGIRLQTRWGNALADARHERFTDDVDRTRVGFAWNLPVAVNHAFRFNWHRIINDSNGITDSLNEVSLGYRFYF